MNCSFLCDLNINPQNPQNGHGIACYQIYDGHITMPVPPTTECAWSVWYRQNVHRPRRDVYLKNCSCIL